MTRQTILITGASSGLGAGMARAFAARHRDVALCARRVDRLEKLKAELMELYPDIKIAVAALDVNNHEQVPKVFAEMRDQLGGIDRVVLSAGLGKGAPLGSGKLWANKATIETNLVAGLVQIETALEMFKQAGSGHLVVISSVASAKGMPGVWSAYSASKAGLCSLGQSLRAEYGKGPIKVSVIEAGPIESDMHHGRTPQRSWWTRQPASRRWSRLSNGNRAAPWFHGGRGRRSSRCCAWCRHW